jgi:CheY-like chemotaxis protein
MVASPLASGCGDIVSPAAQNVRPARVRRPPAVPAAFQIAVLGFSSFERKALASYFRLAANRTPAYHQTSDLARAQFLVVDADQSGVVESVIESGRLRDAVFIGAHAPLEAQSWMMRPLDPLHVLRELDNLVALGHTDSSPVPLSPEPVTPPSRDLRRDPAHSRRASDASARPAETNLLFPLPSDAASTPIVVARPHRALLIDDSELALHFLERQLVPLGLVTQRAMTSGKALDLLAKNSFDIVFIDVELGDRSELDGLELCQRIKARPQALPPRFPVVFLVSAHNDPLDRVRGNRAGCDGYLGKPLVIAELHELMTRHGVIGNTAASPQR